MPANRHDPTTSVDSCSPPSRVVRGPHRAFGAVGAVVMSAGVVAAGLAEPAEGDRVATRLGREVATEPQHVHPPAPPLVGVILTLSQVREGRPNGKFPDSCP